MKTHDLAEVSALVAQMEGDETERDDILDDMFGSELVVFRQHLDALSEAVQRTYTRKGSR